MNLRTLQISIPDHVMSRRVGEEYVLLNLDSETYFGLNPVGALFWAQLEDGNPVNACLTAILAEFDADPTELEMDIQELLKSLSAEGLLEVES